MYFNTEGDVSFSHYEVTVSTVSQLLTHSDYPSNPDITGKLFNFESASKIKDNYCIRMQALFVPPTTGSYVFGAEVDDMANVYLSTDETEAHKIQIITIVGSGAGRQLSEPTNLEHGRKYFLELIGCEVIGNDYFKLSANLPGGDLVNPITYDYLSPLPSITGA